MLFRAGCEGHALAPLTAVNSMRLIRIRGPCQSTLATYGGTREVSGSRQYLLCRGSSRQVAKRSGRQETVTRQISACRRT